MCCYAHITSSAEFVNGTSSFRNWNLFRRRHVIIFTLLTLVCVCSFHGGSIINAIIRPCRKCRSPNKKAVSLVFSQNLPPYFQISRAFIFFFCSLPFRITPKILKFLQISWKTPFHLQIPAFPNNSICLPTKNLSSIKRTKYALYEIRFHSWESIPIANP